MKQSALITQINAALAYAFPKKTKITNIAEDFHRKIWMTAEPFLFDGLRMSTGRIIISGPGFWDVSVFEYDDSGLAKDKRTKWKTKGEIFQPPVIRPLFDCDTVEEAIHIAKVKHFQSQFEGRNNTLKALKADIEEREQDLRRIKKAIATEKREFKKQRQSWKS